MKVPFFNYPFVYKQHESELQRIIHDVANRGAFILQQDKIDFEQNLASFTGASYALGVANGTDAIEIALMAAGIGKGDEVIFSSHTYVATAAAIHYVGATPIPVECGPDHMMDPKSAEVAVTSRTRAILPTQLNGRCCDMSAIDKLAKKHDLLIIEDAAQGLGARYEGKFAGTFGFAGTISFYPAKNLGSFGDAGAILTNHGEVATTCALIHDHGRDNSGEFVRWGRNSRLDNLQAAILNFKLGVYEKEIERRREIAGLYQVGLAGIQELTPPPAPSADSRYFDVYQNYEIEADDRNGLQAYLRGEGIGSLIQWGGKAVHQITALGLAGFSLPFTDQVMKRSLMIPMNTSLSNDDVDYVIDRIRKYYH